MLHMLHVHRPLHRNWAENWEWPRISSKSSCVTILKTQTPQQGFIAFFVGFFLGIQVMVIQILPQQHWRMMDWPWWLRGAELTISGYKNHRSWEVFWRQWHHDWSFGCQKFLCVSTFRLTAWPFVDFLLGDVFFWKHQILQKSRRKNTDEMKQFLTRDSGPSIVRDIVWQVQARCQMDDGIHQR